MLTQKLKSILGIVILLNLTASAFAQDRNANAVDFEKELIQIQSGIWDNPAMLGHQYNKSFTDVSLVWKQRKANGLYRIETGNKTSSIDFDAYSFKRREKNFVFGRASYSKNNMDNIKWNTVSDYSELAPYIVADTIGGKTYGENYSFEGIYSLIQKKSTYALQAKYRSSEDYRKLDPRPKSTVSDLEIKLGGTREINSKYMIGLYAGYHDYQQDHEVDALRPGTGIEVFYLRGLGISDENFSTVVTNSGGVGNIYEKKGYSLGTQLIPIGQTGWYQSFSYKKSKLELLKIVGTGYDIVNDFDAVEFNFSLGKQFQFSNKTVKLKSFGSYQSKTGSEYNYNHNRQLLSVTEKYSAKYLDGGFTSILLVRGIKHSSLYQMEIKYSSDESEYKIANSKNPKQEVEHVTLRLNTGRNFQFSKSSLNIKLEALAQYCINSDLTTSSLAKGKANESLIVPNYEYLKSDWLSLASNIRYDFDTKNTYGIYTKLAYQYMIIENSKSQYSFNFAIGLTL
ncbi:DUF6850 family outer membrane beta-barrel protein [Labilibaculum manganireducens]|uniref:DUF6850 family outer membrane beta-barrel protein n=1 Tax=Labilibaculum manganireducens TaxID=1940525 RepID=UPI0029F47202|nr:DUF6850 family outer membrane beta-barrel protein [Labilibaculum manganireducens]